MEWTDEKLAALPQRDGFRQRGLTPTRLETFCDAAFAFAVTVLVISTGVPGSYDELIAALKDAPAFAASFAVIASFWFAHRTWGHRYGLEDSTSTVLSLAVLFVMLVYVYPLKMMFSAFASFATGGYLPTRFVLETRSDILGLFVVYGIGFAAQTCALALLYRHALRVPSLRLDELEALVTRQKMTVLGLQAATGAVSAACAAFLPTAIGVYAGFVYLTLPITVPILAIRHDKQAERLRRARNAS